MMNLCEKFTCKNLRLILIGFFSVIAIWSVFGVDMHHAHTWAEQHIPLFWFFFGLVSAVALIFVATAFSSILGIKEADNE